MFSDEEAAGEKTEAPTPRRAGQARKDGMVPRSAELSQVIGMTAAFYGLKYILPGLWQQLMLLMRGAFTSRYTVEPLSVPVLQTQFYGILFAILPKLVLILFIAALFGAGATALQTKFLFSTSLIKPKFKLLNPRAGLQRIFSVSNLVTMGKQLFKLAIIGPIAYGCFIGYVPSFLSMMEIPITQLLPLTADMAGTMYIKILKWLFLLSIVDYIWNRYRINKKLKMSKQEIKDEKKASEGDEATKKRIIAIGIQRARERMFLAIPKADVVVTNPTHYAVALAYSTESGGAPKVVAKGKGFVALRIREIAKKNNVPVVERKPLARALFNMVDVGNEIPYELFKAVAELLAYVYRMKGKNPLRDRKKTQPQAGRPN